MNKLDIYLVWNVKQNTGKNALASIHQTPQGARGAIPPYFRHLKSLDVIEDSVEDYVHMYIEKRSIGE